MSYERQLLDGYPRTFTRAVHHVACLCARSAPLIRVSMRSASRGLLYPRARGDARPAQTPTDRQTRTPRH
jgi:hypothetical protein